MSEHANGKNGDAKSSKHKKSVTYEGKMELEQAISYLESLVTSLKSGKVCIQHDTEELSLEVEPTVRLEVEAKDRPHKASLAFEIAWRKPSENDDTPPLHIQSGPQSA